VESREAQEAAVTTTVLEDAVRVITADQVKCTEHLRSSAIACCTSFAIVRVHWTGIALEGSLGASQIILYFQSIFIEG